MFNGRERNEGLRLVHSQEFYACGTVHIQNIITGRNEVLAKVMFLQVSVILLTGGGGVPDQAPPPGPGRYTPPDQAGTPPDQAGTPPSRPGRYTPPSSRPRNTVNDRPVRILLECILVRFKKLRCRKDTARSFFGFFASWACIQRRQSWYFTRFMYFILLCVVGGLKQTTNEFRKYFTGFPFQHYLQVVESYTTWSSYPVIVSILI